MIKGIIFDMDGVLVDSEAFHNRGYQEVLKRYGYDLAEEEFFDYWTRKGGNIVDFVKEKGIDGDPEKIRKDKRRLFRTQIPQIHTYDGTEKVLEALHKKYPLAVVTNSYRKDTVLILKEKNILKYFKFLITRNEMPKPKPEPDGLLLAAKKLKLKPEECVVIEDADKGIISAKRAGMKVIAIPNRYTEETNDFSQADKVLESIKELTVGMIELL